MKSLTNSKLFLIIAILSSLSLGYAIYAQEVQHIIPCPLCITQRIIIFAIAISGFIFAILSYFSHRLLIQLYALVTGIIAIIGIFVAKQHNHLINLPANQQPASCGMPVNVMFQQLSLPNFISEILHGSGECSQVTWRILGMTPPTAVIILCSIILLIAISIILRSKASKAKI